MAASPSARSCWIWAAASSCVRASWCRSRRSHSPCSAIWPRTATARCRSRSCASRSGPTSSSARPRWRARSRTCARALGDDGARQSVIRTLRRRGYRFVAKLDERPAERARAAEARAARGRLERPKIPPFVARGRELRALTSVVAQAGRGRPRVVLISGEAGSGKTRLLEQLLAHPVCADFAIAVGRCRADASLPYLPFAEALGARPASRARRAPSTCSARTPTSCGRCSSRTLRP